MKVVLLEDIKKLGQKGDTVEVANGYARNLLLPRGKAELATPSAVARAEKVKADRRKVLEDLRQTHLDLKAKMDGLKLEMTLKVDDKGKVFGSITTKDIADALKKGGFEIDKSEVLLASQIKALGEYEIEVEFSTHIKSKLKINVTAEK
jgi:large subunit ribosomal protein L9